MKKKFLLFVFSFLISLSSTSCKRISFEKETNKEVILASFTVLADIIENVAKDEFVVKSINRKQFTPDVIQIHVGDTILWENPDVEPHSVSSSNHTKTGELYFNELVYPGETFSYTFTDPGTYFYGCTIKYHGMYGIIRVQK